MSFRSSYPSRERLHISPVIEVILLFEDISPSKVVFIIILSSHHLAGELQKLFFNGIGLLSYFKEGNGQVILV